MLPSNEEGSCDVFCSKRTRCSSILGSPVLNKTYSRVTFIQVRWGVFLSGCCLPSHLFIILNPRSLKKFKIDSGEMEDTAHVHPHHESLFPSLTPFSESQLAASLSLGVSYTFPPQWRILLLKWRENSFRHTIVVCCSVLSGALQVWRAELHDWREKQSPEKSS